MCGLWSVLNSVSQNLLAVGDSAEFINIQAGTQKITCRTQRLGLCSEIASLSSELSEMASVSSELLNL